jgi:hypothetical protein
MTTKMQLSITKKRNDTLSITITKALMLSVAVFLSYAESYTSVDSIDIYGHMSVVPLRLRQNIYTPIIDIPLYKAGNPK